jgi:hypothetical protein
MIKSFLNNSTKFRGKGIDIRSEGGQIIAPPSVRNGKSYEISNLRAPIDIPVSLVAWLLEGHSTKAPKVKSPRANPVNTDRVQKADNTVQLYEYDLNDEQVLAILEKLPEEYLTNYTTWLTVRSILKHHGKHATWSEWCKKGATTTKQKTRDNGKRTKGF